jgi:hypothetical protein
VGKGGARHLNTNFLPHIARKLTPEKTPRTNKGPKDVGDRPVGPDAGARKRFSMTMEESCQGCGNPLWAEDVPVGDRFRTRTCFGEEERSGTYAERVGRCPACGA